MKSRVGISASLIPYFEDSRNFINFVTEEWLFFTIMKSKSLCMVNLSIPTT